MPTPRKSASTSSMPMLEKESSNKRSCVHKTASLSTMDDSDQKQVVKAAKPLLEYSKLPAYLRDNEFIHKHYRADWPLSQTLWSVFGIHNETGNIWTHLLGFLLFVAITVYTAMKVPSSVEIPLSSLNLQKLGSSLPSPPSLDSLRHSLSSQIPNSLSHLELPQLRKLQEALSKVELPQLRQLQRSLSRIELPHLAGLRGSLSNVDLESLYKALPKAPTLRSWEIAARIETMYESLPTLPRIPEFPNLPSLKELRKGAQSSGASLYEAMPNMQEMQGKAEEFLSAMAQRLSQLPRMGQEAVTESLSHLPKMKDMHEAAEPYLSAMAQQFNGLPKMQDVQDAAEPFFAAVSEKFSHLPKIPDVQGTAEHYFAAAAEWLSQLELLHTLHHLEMLMSGVEVSRVQEALHSLVSYYSCLMNSVLLPPSVQEEVCLPEDKATVEPPMCPLQGFVPSANLTSPDNGWNSSGGGSSPSSRISAELTCPAPTLYSKPTPRWPLFLYLAGAMLCLLVSASCHTLGCVSCEVSQVLWRCDYAGIAALISSSFLPPVFYGFLCQPLVRTVYLTAVLIMGVSTVAVSLLSRFQTPAYRHIRAGLFFGMGVSGIIPCMHKFLFYYDEPMVVTTTLLELFMGSLYGLGALLYATRVPERWLPGRFDIAGHSHQLFHLLVIAGAYTHYRTGLLYLEWRDLHGCGVV